PWEARPWEIVKPLRRAAPVTLNTCVALLPLTVSRAAPGPWMVVCEPSVRERTPPVSVIVLGALKKDGWKVMTSAPVVVLAWDTAARSEPAPLSFALVTVKTAGAIRSSRYSSRGRQKYFGRRPRFGGPDLRAFPFIRAASSRHQERDMV